MMIAFPNESRSFGRNPLTAEVDSVSPAKWSIDNPSRQSQASANLLTFSMREAQIDSELNLVSLLSKQEFPLPTILLVNSELASPSSVSARMHRGRLYSVEYTD